jgi:peptidylprolyl isomerase
MGAVSLTAAELKSLLEVQPPEARKRLLSSPEALEQAVRGELVRRTLLAEARGKAWEQRPDVAAAIGRAREQIVVSSYANELARPPDGFPGEAEVRAFYDANRDKLIEPRRYRLAQIYVVRPADATAAQTALERARDLAARARVPGADFAALARSASEHASAASGGEVGWVEESQLIPELRATLSELQVGSVAGPVATTDGWHVVRLAEISAPKPLPLDSARAMIVAALRLRRAQEAEQRYIDALLATTPPMIDRDALEALR